MFQQPLEQTKSLPQVHFDRNGREYEPVFMIGALQMPTDFIDMVGTKVDAGRGRDYVLAFREEKLSSSDGCYRVSYPYQLAHGYI